ncbi:MAG: universal stress protein [Acidaminococcaceae bacterium]|nr:universal stress protein [Acidaminococcaceae bacterium]MBO6265649.1 universal stress protein [Acidaminococcaceae bacterium]MBP3264825.1 universal stress protein [Acidaminococcaceae bacterium]
MFSRVMLALDLSELTSRMLDVLYSVCLDPETEVYLLHVVRKAEDAAETSSYYKKTYSRLKGLAQDIRNAGYDNVKVLWETDEDILNGIRKAADQYNVNLMIMASHGKGVWASTFRGSSTFNAVRAIEIPTLIVKGDYKCDDYLNRILLPTDFSRKSLIALNYIRNLREHVGEVLFVHVIEGVRGDEELTESKEMAEDMLVELCNEMQNFGINSRYVIADGGAASKEICKLAEEENCSLIISGRTGAGPIKGLLMGSTAQNILLNASRTLWVMPDEESED